MLFQSIDVNLKVVPHLEHVSKSNKYQLNILRAYTYSFLRGPIFKKDFKIMGTILSKKGSGTKTAWENLIRLIFLLFQFYCIMNVCSPFPVFQKSKK